MKIQLDYELKVITLQSDVNLKEFVDKIQKLLPDWKEWNIQLEGGITYVPYYQGNTGDVICSSPVTTSDSITYNKDVPYTLTTN